MKTSRSSRPNAPTFIEELVMLARFDDVRAAVVCAAIALLAATTACAATAPRTGAKANRPPVAQITAPAEATTFAGKSVVALVASATDDHDSEDKLVYHWDVDALLADGGRARVLSAKGRRTTFAPREQGHQDLAYDIRLIVTDSKQARDTARVTIQSGAPAATAAAAGGIASGIPLGPGDQVEIEIYAGGEKQEDFTAEVSRAGTLTCPLVGEIPVAGKSSNELATQIRTILARDYFVDPQVLVTVKEYARKIYVSGEVKHPGAYDLQEGLTVMSACTIAGGFTDYAALNRVRVMRTNQGASRTIEVDLGKVRRGKAPDVAIMAGDRIDVPHRRY